MEAATIFARRAMPPAQAPASQPTYIRWLWIWITVGTLVVVVVIGFLLGIVSALKSINSGLAEANASVSNVRGEANPLPFYLHEVNGNLTKINRALLPISGQATQITDALSSIHGRLGTVQSSLVNTSGSLVNTTSSLVSTSGTLGTIASSLVGTSTTLRGIAPSLVDTSNKLVTISGSLVNTSGKLVVVHGLTSQISTVLNNAETVGTNGTQAIWRHVRFANGGSFTAAGFNTALGGPGANSKGLTPVKNDAGTIIAGLGQVNLHLLSICQAPVLKLLLPGVVKPGNC